MSATQCPGCGKTHAEDSEAFACLVMARMVRDAFVDESGMTVLDFTPEVVEDVLAQLGENFHLPGEPA